MKRLRPVDYYGTNCLIESDPLWNHRRPPSCPRTVKQTAAVCSCSGCRLSCRAGPGTETTTSAYQLILDRQQLRRGSGAVKHTAAEQLSRSSCASSSQSLRHSTTTDILITDYGGPFQRIRKCTRTLQVVLLPGPLSWLSDDDDGHRVV